ncbi:hypothetical protein [Cupriavidus sp. SK-3]|uniref:hypothetical protein n=1 Tax=Cupriavidus sp. SK-3 TaxID=1470558 RepID=UPI000B063487|nr:hypothetical protein [Cupriavidus sp. SK-3]
MDQISFVVWQQGPGDQPGFHGGFPCFGSGAQATLAGGHPPAELPGRVRLRAESNFRSPRPVVKMLQPLLPPDVEIEATAPISAAEVEFLVYEDNAGLLQSVKDGIRMCYSAGFRKEDVALLSYRGRKNSRLLGYDQLGPHKLRSFTGNYDALGQPIYSQGDVLAESVFRLKGQSAPAVVFAEIDFESMTEKEIRGSLLALPGRR